MLGRMSGVKRVCEQKYEINQICQTGDIGKMRPKSPKCHIREVSRHMPWAEIMPRKLFLG